MKGIIDSKDYFSVDDLRRVELLPPLDMLAEAAEKFSEKDRDCSSPSSSTPSSSSFFHHELPQTNTTRAHDTALVKNRTYIDHCRIPIDNVSKLDLEQPKIDNSNRLTTTRPMSWNLVQQQEGRDYDDLMTSKIFASSIRPRGNNSRDLGFPRKPKRPTMPMSWNLVQQQREGRDYDEIRKSKMKLVSSIIPKGNSRKPKRSKTTTRIQHALDPNPELPEPFKLKIQEFGGWVNEPQLMIEKKLTATDVTESESRLSMPKNQVKHKLMLTEHERSEVKRKVKNRVVGFEVTVIEPRGEVCVVTLKRWKSSNVNWYVFCEKWNHLVRVNSLKKDDRIQVWSFRLHQHNNQLCFAIVKLINSSHSIN